MLLQVSLLLCVAARSLSALLLVVSEGPTWLRLSPVKTNTTNFEYLTQQSSYGDKITK